MAQRRPLNPNVDSPSEPYTRRAEHSTPTAEERREDIRADARSTAEALDDTMTLQEADARREVPRIRTDSANPRMDQRLPAPSAVRGFLSSRRQKSYNIVKTEWEGSLPKTRKLQVQTTLSNREEMEGVNRLLNATTGIQSDLPNSVRRRVRAMDRAIQDYERRNPREHVVYATLRSPKDHGNSRNALRRKLAEMSADPQSPPLTFDSYVPATHNLSQVPEGPDVVMEIRTRSGAYLGTSDTTRNADHVVGRGRTLRPVGVHEVAYLKDDGTQGSRWIVQMEDVTEDGRTETREASRRRSREA